MGDLAERWTAPAFRSGPHFIGRGVAKGPQLGAALRADRKRRGSPPTFGRDARVGRHRRCGHRRRASE